MGQRHQLYFIAQVGSRYRVLAALHHHWLWAEHAVRQSRIVLETLRREGNLAGIRREVQRAGEINWEEGIWVDEQKTRADESIFPFLATCLLLSSTLGQFCPTTALMPINWDFDDVSRITNDDGVSIFDVSELGKPRYGFLFPGENVLMDGEMYLQEGYRIALGDRNLEPNYDFGTVSLHALRSTWPGRDFSAKLGRVMPEIPAVAELKDSLGKLSLKEQSIARLVDAAFESGDLGWMKEAELVKEFSQALARRLRMRPELVKGSHGVFLLGYAMRNEEIVDLSPFQLVREEVLRVLKLANEGSKERKERALVLPNIEGLTAADLEGLLKDLSPTTLDIGDTPDIPLQELLDLIAGSSVVHFTCFALYKRSLETIGPRSHLLPNLPASQFPSSLTSNFPITQMVYLQHINDNNPSGNNTKWSTFTPTPRPTSSSSYILPLCLPLHDSLLSPSHASSLLTTMLPLLLSIRNPSSPERLGTQLLAVAERFANLAGPRTTLPIPAQMYSDFRRYAYGEQEPLPKFAELKAGEWTLLVTAVVRSSPASNAIKPAKYAFLSRAEDGELEVRDAEGFFEATARDAERRAALLEEWGHCCKALEQGEWSVLGEERIRLQGIEKGEAKDAVEHLTAFNETVDEYEEANQEKLRRSRQARMDARAKGSLVIRL